MSEDTASPLWTPDAERLETSRMSDYMRWLERERSLHFDGYEALWRWSVENLEAFWDSVWDYFNISHSSPYERVLDSHRMPGAKWFQGSYLNFAEQIFCHRERDRDDPAILSRSELRPLGQMSWGELRCQVASVGYALRDLGVKPGDRVAAYLPNVPETVVAFLACASVGAIWSCCSPDMGTRSVVDRFQQIEPKVFIAADGYRYGGHDYDRLEVVSSLRRALPTLEQVVLLPYLNGEATLEGARLWHDLLGHDVPLHFAQVPFDQPLWVVYSSGTTGIPKAIVHGHGGALIEGVKGHALHLDLGPADRYMWFSTTGWIMWNSQVCGLLTGASICLYDGKPDYPALGVLWEFAQETGMTFFGAGAAYFTACMKAGLEPTSIADLSRLRSVGSTGSPLPAEAYEWIQQQVGHNVLIAARSGGTDVAASFVGACPIKPLFAGEMQCRELGIAACALDADGNELQNEVGELVITEPMPSMPLYLWNDPDGRRYRESYFEKYPGRWRHGDWIRITPRGGAIIYGRSDTTINRRGIRMGTGEIYRVVDSFPEIVDSLVVDLEYLGRPSYMPLFVLLQPGKELAPQLSERLRRAIRTELSARHVPDEILAVDDIPRTLTGKKMELPIKKLLLGMPADEVVNPDAMSNPDSLQYYISLAARLAESSGAAR